MLLLVLHHFLALSDEVWSGLGQRSPQVVSRYGLLPPLVIFLKFIEGNAFGLPTTIKQSLAAQWNHNFFQKLSNLASFSTCFAVTRSVLIRELDHL